MIFLLISFIFCNQCPWYFEDNKIKIGHNCRIKKFDCFYSIRTQEIKDTMNTLHLQVLENHNNATEKLKELDYFQSKISEEIKNLLSYKYDKIKFNDKDFVSDSNHYSEYFYFNYIEELLNKCSQEFKKYKILIESDCMVSFLDQKDEIENKKLSFLNNHKNLLPIKPQCRRKSVHFNVNGNKFSKDYSLLAREFTKSKKDAINYTKICRRKDDVLNNILRKKCGLKEILENEFVFNRLKSLYELKSNFMPLKNNNLAVKLFKRLKIFKNKALGVHANKRDEIVTDSSIDLNENMSNKNIKVDEGESENLKNVCFDIKESHYNIHIKMRIVLCIFDELIDLYDLIHSVDIMKRNLIFEYYLHEINKLKEIMNYTNK